MIYDGRDVLMNMSEGRELRYILDGGIHKLDEDDLNKFMTDNYETLAKDLYIYLSYDLYEHINTNGELITKIDDINNYALSVRGQMASLYKREFKDRMYRHYINQIFSDIDNDDIIIDGR